MGNVMYVYIYMYIRGLLGQRLDYANFYHFDFVSPMSL